MGRLLLCGCALALTLVDCAGPITSYEDPIHHTNSPNVGPPGLEGYYYLPRTILTLEVKTVGQAQDPTKAGGAGTGTGAPATGSAPAANSGGGDGAVVSVENVTLARKVEADPRARLLYRFEPSPISDDVLQIDSEESGLLATITSDTTDRSGSIAIAFADLVFAISTHGAPAVGGAGAGKSFFSEPKTPLKASFDPADAAETSRVRAALLQRGYCLLLGTEIKRAEEIIAAADRSVVRVQGEVAAAAKSGGDVTAITAKGTDAIKRATESLISLCTKPAGGSSASPALDYASRNRGIYYRRPIPAPMALYKIKDSNNSFFQEGRPSLLWTGSVPVFDKGEIYRVDIDRAAFVRKQTVIKFSNGSLTSIKMDKPSEVLAGIQVPVQIARIAFAAPLAGLQQDTALTKAQTEQLTAQTNYIKAQTELMKLQTQVAGNSIVATPR